MIDWTQPIETLTCIPVKLVEILDEEPPNLTHVLSLTEWGVEKTWYCDKNGCWSNNPVVRNVPPLLVKMNNI